MIQSEEPAPTATESDQADTNNGQPKEVLDTPSENMTTTSSTFDEEEEDEHSYYSSDDDDDDDSCSETSSHDGYDHQYRPSATKSKSKRVSYSKDLLKPTKQGGLIQAGFDVKQASVVSDGNNPTAKHTPDYAKKQLKATSFGAKVKKGADVPRDHVPQPVDPNAALGDMYKSHQSTNFKSTGFGAQLKRGADVPRDHILQPADPNAKLGDMYASVNFKQTGFGAQLKQGQDVPRDHVPQPVDPNAALGDMYASVTLKKAGNPAKSSPKNSSSATLLPTVSLQKTSPATTKAPTKFELPEEMLTARTSLKKRADRPWYSKGVGSDAKPTKKWFFQRGEWNDEKKPYEATTFFRGSNSTMFPKTKANIRPQYHVANYNRQKKKGTNPLKPYNKEYYDDIRRRRLGLPPKRARSVWRRLLLAFVIVPLVMACGICYTLVVHPEHAKVAWQKVRGQPMVDQLLEQIQPVLEQIKPVLEQIQPVLEQIKPVAFSAVDRTCTFVEALVVPEQYQRWIDPVQTAAVSSCTVIRTKLGMATVLAHGEALKKLERDARRTNTRGEALKNDPGVEAMYHEKVDKQTPDTSSGQECRCHKGPKWLHLVLGFLRLRNKNVIHCCY